VCLVGCVFVCVFVCVCECLWCGVCESVSVCVGAVLCVCGVCVWVLGVSERVFGVYVCVCRFV